MLNEIQKKLKAPKGQENKFGGYNYRSAEKIFEAVKPHLGKAVLTLSDDIVEVGGRVYVKATATLTLDKEVWSTTAYAREPMSRKGMDESQITGAASSYARKYALSGLFCIDDNKDADTMDNRDQGNQSPQEMLESCTNLKMLAEVWGSLTKEDHLKYQTLKDDLKDRLTGKAA